MTSGNQRVLTSEEADFLRAIFDRSQTEQATLLYEALVNRGEIHTSRVRCLTYRCEQRNKHCSLLDVFDAGPLGIIIGFPRYKTSPAVTARTSNASGRAANTEDGDRRWKRHAGTAPGEFEIPVNCDHLLQVRLHGLDIVADYEAGHREIRVRRDGSRCAVH